MKRSDSVQKIMRSLSQKKQRLARMKDDKSGVQPVQEASQCPPSPMPSPLPPHHHLGDLLHSPAPMRAEGGESPATQRASQSQSQSTKPRRHNTAPVSNKPPPSRDAGAPTRHLSWHNRLPRFRALARGERDAVHRQQPDVCVAAEVKVEVVEVPGPSPAPGAEGERREAREEGQEKGQGNEERKEGGDGEGGDGESPPRPAHASPPPSPQLGERESPRDLFPRQLSVQCASPRGRSGSVGGGDENENENEHGPGPAGRERSSLPVEAEPNHHQSRPGLSSEASFRSARSDHALMVPFDVHDDGVPLAVVRFRQGTRSSEADSEVEEPGGAKFVDEERDPRMRNSHVFNPNFRDSFQGHSVGHDLGVRMATSVRTGFEGLGLGADAGGETEAGRAEANKGGEGKAGSEAERRRHERSSRFTKGDLLGSLGGLFAPRHSAPRRDALRLFVTTWNVGNAAPDFKEWASWFSNDPKNPYDLVVVGVQECNFKASKQWKRDRKKYKHEVELQHPGLETTPSWKSAKSDPQARSASANNNQEARQGKGPAMAKEEGAGAATLGVPENGRERRKAASAFSGWSRRDHKPKIVSSNPFISMLQMQLGVDYREVARVRLMDMQLVALAHVSVHPFVSEVECSSKATGLGGVIGNKGGLMVKLRVFETTLCFLSCHLTPHEGEKQVKSRNHDVQEIVKSISNSTNKRLDVWFQYDHTFVLGDLNYRINLGAHEDREEWEAQHKEVVEYARRRQFELLYRNDQLRHEMRAWNVLVGFQENPPCFPPTYKVLRNKRLQYTTQRMPSYCDRVLYTSAPDKEDRLDQLEYGAVPSVTSSDHKPVFSVFQVRTTLPKGTFTLPPTRSILAMGNRGARRVRLRVSHLRAMDLPIGLRMGMPANPVARFYGKVLVDEKTKTKVLYNSTNPQWTNIPVLNTKALDAVRLCGQYLVISIWNNEARRTRWTLLGQCALWLDDWANPRDYKAREFRLQLVRHGVPSGVVTGTMHVMGPDN